MSMEISFEEYICKRCDNIATNDERYNEITQRSMLAYNNLRKAFAEYVNITTELQAYSEKLMLQTGICEKHKKPD